MEWELMQLSRFTRTERCGSGWKVDIVVEVR